MTYSSSRLLTLANSAYRGNLTAIRDAFLDIRGVMGSISATTLAYLASVTAGTGAVSKAMVLDSSGNFIMPSTGVFGMSRAALAAAGTDATNGGAIVTQIAAVTGADGTKGVVLPAAAVALGPILVINTVLTSGGNLNVYPVNGGNDNINGLAEDLAFVVGPGEAAWFIPTSATQWYVRDRSGVLATTTEINQACDISSRIVVLTATTAITEALHQGRTMVMREAGGNALCTFTLPAATGGGGKYRFVVDEVNTSNYVIKAANGADVFRGTVLSASTTDSATDAVNSWTAGATDDTLTLDGTTTGGVTRGDWVEFEDCATDGWFVRGFVTQSGTEATMFSDTVA